MIRVDATSFVPIYEQIKKEILRLVTTGRLKVRDPLPSIRDLAAELIVNPNTVARAYRELEQDGLVSAQKGRGSFVARRPEPGADKDIQAHLARVMDEAVAEARKFGLGEGGIQRLFEERLRAGADGKNGRSA
ncbi:MAG TPA: GntR family transcriptional regulator [Terriglobales bacterium]|nr:GntR family transcriptional regulator [Terriglobales bacterium]